MDNVQGRINWTPSDYLAKTLAENTQWNAITDDEADYCLSVLPPIYFKGGFFVSEASYHDDRGIPAYLAVTKHNGQYYKREVVRDRIEAALLELPTL